MFKSELNVSLSEYAIVPSAHEWPIKRKKRVGAEKSDRAINNRNSVENDRNPKHNVANFKYHTRVLSVK